MITKIGKLFDFEGENNMLMVPVALSFRRNSQELRMGEGLALQAAKHYPYLPKQLGEWYKAHPRDYHISFTANVLTFPIKDKEKGNLDPLWLGHLLWKLKKIQWTTPTYDFYFPLEDITYKGMNIPEITNEVFETSQNVILVKGIGNG